MTSTPKTFKIGDRVVANSRNPGYQGRKGKVTYATGGQYWVKFDDSDEVAAGMHPWTLDPLPE